MTPTKQEFSLGRLVITRGVDELMTEDIRFRAFVQLSLGRYSNCDWGDVCDSAWQHNDNAIRVGARILASYHHVETQTKIWIITEWDQSVTTILLPEEY